MYDEVVNEDVPDDFLGLLEEADDRGPDTGQVAALNGNGAEHNEPAHDQRPVKTEP